MVIWGNRGRESPPSTQNVFVDVTVDFSAIVTHFASLSLSSSLSLVVIYCLFVLFCFILFLTYRGDWRLRTKREESQR